MPKKVHYVRWECKFCQSQYPYKVQAQNCESACKTQRDKQTIQESRRIDLEEKYFPRYRDACGKCQKNPIESSFTLNMCNACFKEEFLNLEKNLKDKKYQEALTSILAKIILRKT